MAEAGCGGGQAPLYVQDTLVVWVWVPEAERGLMGRDAGKRGSGGSEGAVPGRLAFGFRGVGASLI